MRQQKQEQQATSSNGGCFLNSGLFAAIVVTAARRQRRLRAYRRRRPSPARRSRCLSSIHSGTVSLVSSFKLKALVGGLKCILVLQYSTRTRTWRLATTSSSSTGTDDCSWPPQSTARLLLTRYNTQIKEVQQPQEIWLRLRVAPLRHLRPRRPRGRPAWGAMANLVARKLEVLQIKYLRQL